VTREVERTVNRVATQSGNLNFREEMVFLGLLDERWLKIAQKRADEREHPFVVKVPAL
jgi:hypothetical protein